MCVFGKLLSNSISLKSLLFIFDVHFSAIMLTLFLNQNCGIAQPSEEAESLASAAELWQRTERELGIS